MSLEIADSSAIMAPVLVFLTGGFNPPPLADARGRWRIAQKTDPPPTD
jgi:hypothetical protein